jgi:hypothetical protein
VLTALAFKTGLPFLAFCTEACQLVALLGLPVLEKSVAASTTPVPHTRLNGTSLIAVAQVL